MESYDEMNVGGEGKNHRQSKHKPYRTKSGGCRGGGEVETNKGRSKVCVKGRRDGSGD